jgi:2-C-methyl-D-erythritol 4-phosphate cytidylyltransferase
MNLAVIIPAAGASTRYQQAAADAGVDPGATRSKLDEDLGGRPVLQRTVELFANHPAVSSIIVAGPHDENAFAEFKDRYGDKLGLLGVRLTRGGSTHRYQTVAAALAHVPDSCSHVAVHDAARPCTPADLIERVIEAAERHPAVIPAVDVSDTLKRVGDPIAETHADPLAAILGEPAPSAASGPRPVTETVDRSGLVAVQTPQVFERALLLRAYAQKDLSSTDDAQLVERLGERVLVVRGDGRNIKITRPGDLHMARVILSVRAPEQRAAHKRF